MLDYLAKYKYGAYVGGAVATAVIILVWTGAAVLGLVPVLPGVMTTLTLLFVITAALTVVLEKRAQSEAAALVAVYDQACDPAGFVEQGSAIANRIEPPYDEAASWFMSNYALALLDVGRTSEAREVLSNLQGSVVGARAKQKAALLVNAEPLALRLDGTQAALDIIEAALFSMKEHPSQGDEARRSYLTWERQVVLALDQGDWDALLPKLESVRDNGAYPMRMRVLDADAAASIHRAAGNVDGELACLRFVVENGNALPVVEAAERRLDQLHLQR